MTLLLTVFAAIIVTIIWYTNEKARCLQVGTLCLMYWGATLMWTVDAVAEYIALRADYFQAAPADMLNDAFLGLSVVALGLVIYLVVLLVRDPAHVIAPRPKKRHEK